MFIVRQLIMLLMRDLPIRAIAAELSIGTRTVAAYRKRIQQSTKTCEELLILDDLTLTGMLRPTVDSPRSDKRLGEFTTQLEYYLSELARKRASRVILFEE